MDPLEMVGSLSRWRLLEILIEGEKSVGEMSETLHISNQGVLKHIGVLVDAGLVKEIRAEGGRKVTYALRQGVFLHRSDDDAGELILFYRKPGRARRLEPEREFRARRMLRRLKMYLNESL
jgi:predicted ArsR family transcriptional regulator